MARSKKAKNKATARVALVASFADLPDAELVLAQHGIAKLARRGFYAIGEKQPCALFENHPESKLDTKTSKAGLALVENLAQWASDEIGELLVGETKRIVGFHADLDARALAKAMEEDGFRVAPFPLAPAASLLLVTAKDPWPFVRTRLRAKDVDLANLLLDVSARARGSATTPPADVLDELARRIDSASDLGSLRFLLERAGADLVACARPFVARAWKPKTAKGKPRGLPPDLATLLGAVDGIPPIGVWPASKIPARMAHLRGLAPGRRNMEWSPRDPQVRIDRVWRDGWIPFGQRPDDEYLAIDLEPTAKGAKGHVIGVRLSPPRLYCYRPTLGAWLWNELDTHASRG